MCAADLGHLGRRQFVTTACAGALTGAAWALGLKTALGNDDLPTVTVTRTGSSTAALVDYQRHRVLLLNASPADQAVRLIETTAGFMRQRIDVLLVPEEAMGAVSPAITRRWAVGSVLEIPKDGGHAARAVSGRALAVGNLVIAADRQFHGAWRATAVDALAPWFATIRFGETQIVIAGPGAIFDRLPIEAASASCLVTCDRLDDIPNGLLTDAIAAPAESDLQHIQEARGDLTIVPLHRERPVVLRLTNSAIHLPAGN